MTIKHIRFSVMLNPYKNGVSDGQKSRLKLVQGLK